MCMPGTALHTKSERRKRWKVLNSCVSLVSSLDVDLYSTYTEQRVVAAVEMRQTGFRRRVEMHREESWRDSFSLVILQF
jgi:hypothetical protein